MLTRSLFLLSNLSLFLFSQTYSLQFGPFPKDGPDMADVYQPIRIQLAQYNPIVTQGLPPSHSPQTKQTPSIHPAPIEEISIHHSTSELVDEDDGSSINDVHHGDHLDHFVEDIDDEDQRIFNDDDNYQNYQPTKIMDLYPNLQSMTAPPPPAALSGGAKMMFRFYEKFDQVTKQPHQNRLRKYFWFNSMIPAPKVNGGPLQHSSPTVYESTIPKYLKPILNGYHPPSRVHLLVEPRRYYRPAPALVSFGNGPGPVGTDEHPINLPVITRRRPPVFIEQTTIPKHFVDDLFDSLQKYYGEEYLSSSSTMWATVATAQPKPTSTVPGTIANPKNRFKQSTTWWTDRNGKL